MRRYLPLSTLPLVTLCLFALAPTTLAQGDADSASFGWLSLLPPLLAIALALISRDVLLSLFLGVFSGALILAGGDPFTAFARTIDQFIVEQMTDDGQAPILVFTTLLGGMVGVITKNGGTHGIVARLAPYATNAKRGQLATWVMGVIVFFDDYANTLIVGPTMRPITDKLKISREKLAYIVDSTAAPVVCLFPISTWVGFEVGQIAKGFEASGVEFDAYGALLLSIPYRFYPIFALVLGFTIASTRFDFGPMRRAEERARDTGAVLAADAQPIAEYGSEEVEPPADIPKRAWNALLPIVTVVAITVLGLWITGTAEQTRPADASLGEWIRMVLTQADSLKALMWASLAGVVVALVLALSQRLLKLNQAMGAMLGGFKAMLMALVVLILAWGLGGVCGELGTAPFLVQLTEGVVDPLWLPALTFVLSAGVAFATGSSWGTMGIVEPLVIPIAHNLALAEGLALGSEQYWTVMAATIASVLTGAVWGDHCSPISDTTILSSMATGCDHIAHVRTQIPYALGAGTVAVLIGSVPAAYGLSPWISLPFGTVIIVGFVFGFGRYREQRRARMT